MQQLTDESSISQLLKELTLEEKINFVIAAGPCPSYAIGERDIPSIIFADGVTGVNATHILLDFFMEMQKMARKRAATGAAPAENRSSSGANMMGQLQALVEMTPENALQAAQDNPMAQGFLRYLQTRRNPAGAMMAFPSGNNIGACFNDDRAYEIGQAVGTEMRASNLNVCLGPNVDIIRDPLGGRNYEMYGEDPVLVGNTAAAFIRGMQSTGTAACAKHFIANNQETRRQTKNTHVSERTLRELYAKGFEKSVKKAGVKSVMSAYNAVNGIFSSYNKTILTDWLKEEWGFDGVVVSDWGAVTGRNDKAIAAGMDLVLHGPMPCDSSDIAEAIRNGTLEEARLDDAVERILKLVLWIRQQTKENSITFDLEGLQRKAYETIVDGAVLLKNEGILPLPKETMAALYGSRAKDTMECGSGSTYVTTSLHTNVYEESEKLGVPLFWENMDKADTVIYVAGAEGGENADRSSMALDDADEKQILCILRQAKEQGKKTVVVLNIAAPVDMRKWMEFADAILVIFIPGSMGGKACADILFGKATPCGRLPMTFPAKLKDSPASPYPIGERDDVYYSEGIYVGYRWYDEKELKPQFPFGHGLSYTTFDKVPVVKPDTWDVRKKETLDVSIRIKNTGNVYGCEVLQLYMGYQSQRVPMPVKTLKAYKKVYLQPGEEQTVTLTIDRSDLEIFDPEKGLLTPIGEYRILLGTSSEAIFDSFMLHVDGNNPYQLDENSTLGDIMDNEAAYALMKECVPQFFSIPESYMRNMRNDKIGDLLARRLIGAIPDANELKGITDRFFAKLAHL